MIKKDKKSSKNGVFDVKITQIKITKKNEFYLTKNC